MKTSALALAAALAALSVPAAILDWDAQSLKADGRRTFLVSGEFHYFRVPKDDWARRMRLFKEAGGNCLATYVPWIVHEPEEGRILFGDCPERDLAGFLRTAADEGLMVILRPGPYCYSELVRSGMPKWIADNHPETRAVREDGRPFGHSLSYMHPKTLELARRYYRAVADVVRPFMASNGGPVVMVQLDNETGGIHLWAGGVDCNRETFAAEGDFDPRSLAHRRAYFRQVNDYLVTLAQWLEEDGIGGPYCTNAGEPRMGSQFVSARERLGRRFLVGFDHYYNLGLGHPQQNPTDLFMLKSMLGADIVTAQGYPAVVLEMQAGNLADFPPTLKEDLLADYMLHLALGVKGLNYYIFTGGRNLPGTGTTGDIYDYGAPVSWDGKVRRTYGALAEFGAFVRAHPELVERDRDTSVGIGFEFPHYCGCIRDGLDERFVLEGAAYTLMQTACSPRHVELNGRLDPGRALVLAGVRSMSAAAQTNVLAFVRAGGRLLVAPDFPRQDADGRPCALLADALDGGVTASGSWSGDSEFLLAEGVRAYGLDRRQAFAGLPADCRSVLSDPDTGACHGYIRRAGEGTVIRLGVTWRAQYVSQIRMLERMLDLLGARKVVASDNPAVFATLLRDGKGGWTAFAMNLQSSPQEAEIAVYGESGDRPVVRRRLALAAMSVQAFDSGN